MKLTALVRKAIITWECTQVELHGQHSVERLQQLKRYQDTTSPFRMACVISTSVLPCLLLALLTDVIPLQDPFSKVPHTQLLFWARDLIVSVTLTFVLLMDCRALATRLKMSMRQLIALTGFISVGTSASIYGLSKLIGFPVPFTIVHGGFVWCSLCAASFFFTWSDLIRHSHSVRAELAMYTRVLFVPLSLIIVYPAYSFLFLQLPSSAQIFYPAPLLLIKLVAKNTMVHLMRAMDDLKPQQVIFHVEVFHALFIASSMQNSKPKRESVDPSDAEQLEFVQKSLKLFYLTEFLILIEFTEVVMPIVYSCYLFGVSHLPNRVYYPQLRAMEDKESLQATLVNLAIFSALEWISFLVFAALLKRKITVSPICQLAFVLESQWQLIQSKLTLWVLFMVQSSLDHFGADYTLQFAWLKGVAT